MKTTKRKMLFHSFYDHTGIEAHLERMAEQGWLLDKIGKAFWHYRRIEPRKLAFAVSYFPRASAFDPGPSEEQETFYDFCAHTGWTLAASSAQMQVFYNDRPSPVPIDTDPALEVDAIHQSAKKGYLISMFVFLGLAIMEEAMFAVQLLTRPLDMLCNSYAIFATVCYLALFLLTVVELTSYYTWRRRAKRAAEQGEFLPTRSHPVFQKALLALIAAGFVWLAASQASGGDGPLAVSMVVLTCSIFVIIAVVSGVSALMKRKNVSRDTNLMVTYTLTIVLSLAVVSIVVLSTISLMDSGPGQAIRPNEFPLTLPELLGVPLDDGDWDRDLDVTQSPLMGYWSAQQYLWNKQEESGPAWLSYSIVVVKAPFLYGVCKDEMLSRYDTRDRTGVPEGQKMWYEPADPAPWGAEEAYWRYHQNPEAGNREYLLCYPGRIVEITFDWEPTPEQIALAAEKLGGQ